MNFYDGEAIIVAVPGQNNTKMNPFWRFMDGLPF